MVENPQTNFGRAAAVVLQRRCALAQGQETAHLFNVSRQADRWEYSACLYEEAKGPVSNFRLRASASQGWAVTVEALSENPWAKLYAEGLQDEIVQKSLGCALESTVNENLLAVILEEVDTLDVGDTIVVRRDRAVDLGKGLSVTAVQTADGSMFWFAAVAGQGYGAHFDVTSEQSTWRAPLHSVIQTARRLSRDNRRSR